MNLPRTLCLTALLSTLIGLSSCGGGGGHDGALTTFPTSGAYGWINKQVDSKVALSLVHPSQPDNEYQIDTTGVANIFTTQLVSSGSVDTATQRVASIQPHTLLYIMDGQVRSVPLQANGDAPSSRVRHSSSTSACRFLKAANDYATPFNSRFLVSVKSASGACDGAAELRFASDGALVYTPFTGEQPLGVVRDAATLAPRGWIFSRTVVLWDTSPATTVTIRPAAARAITKVVDSTYRTALVDDGERLSVVDFSGGTSFSQAPLNAALTAGGNWEPIGFDADNFYVYSTATDGQGAPTWKVLKISRAAPAASLLASGSGPLARATMGVGVLYLALNDPGPDVVGDNSRLIRVNKATGALKTTAYSPNTQAFVRTTSTGIHQLGLYEVGYFPASHVLATTLQYIDENDTSLYSAINAFSVQDVEASAVDFNNSVNLTRFVFSGAAVTGYFSDAPLFSYDSTTRTLNMLGTLPSAAAALDKDLWFNASAGPTRIGLGFTVLRDGNSRPEASARVFSFDLDTPNSLKYTTTTK
ncbi:MAG: hypothetical protein ACKVOX_17045 [Rhizobacter sp.]